MPVMCTLLPFRCLSALRVPLPATQLQRACISTSPSHSIKNLPPRPKPPPNSEIEESYLKGSGPGGQKIVRLLYVCSLLSRRS